MNQFGQWIAQWIDQWIGQWTNHSKLPTCPILTPSRYEWYAILIHTFPHQSLPRYLLLLLSQFGFLGLDPLRHVLLEVLFPRLQCHIVPCSTQCVWTPKPAVIFYVVLPSLDVGTENKLFIAVWRSPTSLPRLPPHPPALACTLDCEHWLLIRDLKTIQTTMLPRKPVEQNTCPSLNLGGI